MSNKNRDKLIGKYLEATSGLEEEQEIFETEEAGSDLDPWFRFVKGSRTKAPENLNDSVWNAIQSKRKGSHRLIYGIVATAASIALIITLSVNGSKQSYKEKEALLTEALSMFHDDDKQQKAEQTNIIYEDELIVIYTTSK